MRARTLQSGPGKAHARRHLNHSKGTGHDLLHCNGQTPRQPTCSLMGGPTRFCRGPAGDGRTASNCHVAEGPLRPGQSVNNSLPLQGTGRRGHDLAKVRDCGAQGDQNTRKLKCGWQVLRSLFPAGARCAGKGFSGRVAPPALASSIETTTLAHDHWRPLNDHKALGTCS